MHEDEAATRVSIVSSTLPATELAAMKARILLQTATAAAAGAAATRPQCLLATFLSPLHHRRFQSNKSNSSPPRAPLSPPSKQSKGDPATLESLLGGLLTDSPSTNSFSLLNNYSLPASHSSRGRHSPTSSQHILLSNLGLSSPSSTGTSFFDQALGGPPPIADTARVPRMGPTAGRSVLVQGDVTVAFTRLKSLVQANRVRSDLMKQRFHERPGLKKKRLKRERHRRRFKEAFKRMVGVVLDMKNRGM
ncbi:hypothetical protein EV426DRAFT_434784 [Tirmania nivea]|nr:hypothetical protein EV426DRAFT_434784 [Tirmania nivea]